MNSNKTVSNGFISATSPAYDGKVPHLRITKDDITDIVLLPGDPGRVEFFTTMCDDFKIIARNREFTTGKGIYKGIPIMVCSTGIGAASTEIAVMELISLGAKALIRIGGTGAILPEIPVGSIVLNRACMRRGGSSIFYAPGEYPASASFEILESLKNACVAAGAEYNMGICASVGSFYAGQGREFKNGEFIQNETVINTYQNLGITNLEMEAETIFTLASVYGVMAGSICVVHCNRATDRWLVDFEPAQRKMCALALEGAVLLNKNYLMR